MADVPSTTLDDVSVTAPAPAKPTPKPPEAQPAEPNIKPNIGLSTSYAERRLDITFVPASGKGKTYSRLRALVNVQMATMGHGATAQIRIQGMTLSDINNFSRAGTTFISGNNRVKVEAGTVSGQLTTVFSGLVSYAYPDFDNQPDVAFVIQAFGATDIQINKADPQTFNQQVDSSQAITTIAKAAGITVKNQGVKTKLTNPYFSGSVWQQLNRAIDAAGAVGYYDPIKREVTIQPKPQVGQATGGGKIAVISPQQGMIGYPKFQQNKVFVRCIFSPEVNLTPMSKIKIQSELASANGIFSVYQVDLSLSSEMPNGPWEMTIMCTPDQMVQR